MRRQRNRRAGGWPRSVCAPTESRRGWAAGLNMGAPGCGAGARGGGGGARGGHRITRRSPRGPAPSPARRAPRRRAPPPRRRRRGAAAQPARGINMGRRWWGRRGRAEPARPDPSASPAPTEQRARRRHHGELRQRVLEVDDALLPPRAEKVARFRHKLRHVAFEARRFERVAEEAKLFRARLVVDVEDDAGAERGHVELVDLEGRESGRSVFGGRPRPGPRPLSFPPSLSRTSFWLISSSLALKKWGDTWGPMRKVMRLKRGRGGVGDGGRVAPALCLPCLSPPLSSSLSLVQHRHGEAFALGGVRVLHEAHGALEERQRGGRRWPSLAGAVARRVAPRSRPPTAIARPGAKKCATTSPWRPACRPPRAGPPRAPRRAPPPRRPSSLLTRANASSPPTSGTGSYTGGREPRSTV